MTATLPRTHADPARERRVVRAAVALAAVGGLATVYGGMLVVLALGAILLFVAAAYRPPFATYAYLATLPFLAGIERGAIIPSVRANEAMLALMLAGAALGGYLRYLRGDPIPLRWGRMDPALVGFVVLSTVWPITSMMVRGITPHGSDVMAVLPIVKLTALLVLVRITIRSDSQLVRCVRLVVWPAAVVAVIAILQTLSFGPVLAVLAAAWPVEPGSGLEQRGTTTLGSSIATGDYIIIGLTLLVCCAARGLLRRWESYGLGFVLSAGVLAAGQFSTWISAVVAGVVLLWRFPELRRRAVRFLPLVGVAVLIGAPAFLGRLSDFAAGFSVPRSWLGRWDNVTNFHLPPLLDGGWLLGVSPDSVLTAPETWREVIYLEAGYLQFLWVGGVALLAGFVWLTVSLLRQTARLRNQPGVVGAYALALEVGWWVVLVMSVIDIHLVLRGAGDLLFVLIAVVSGRVAYERVG